LIVAITIFAVGGGVSLYEGISHLMRPQMPENPFWNYLVLGFAFVFEGISWLFGWKAFCKAKGKQSVLEAIHRSKDPSTFMVVFEDSGALLGLVIAFCGVFFGRQLSNPYLDGIASIVIGLMLGLMSTFLAYESKGLLIGEGVERETLRGLRSLVERDTSIEKVSRLLTMYFGPHEVMLVLDVRFRTDLSAAGVRSAIARLKRNIKEEHPDITRIFLAVESVSEDETKEKKKAAGRTEGASIT